MYCVFYTTAKDFIISALDSISPNIARLVLINNSNEEFVTTGNRVEVMKPLYPMTFSQTFNYVRGQAIKNGMTVLFTMHDDGQFVSHEDCDNFVNYVQSLDGKWGQVLTRHDVVTAYNVEMLKDVGEMDIVFPQYFADYDYFKRMELKGWSIIQSEFSSKVRHLNDGSNTIKNHPHLKLTQNYTFPLYEQYYVYKWGGKLGQEKYKVPFNKEVGNENS